MHTLIFSALVFAQPANAPLAFDTLSLNQATQHDGKEVTISFTVGSPAYTTDSGPIRTVTGPADRGDGVKWVVILRGNRRAALDDGVKVKVRGTLRVIDHPAVFVGGVLVPEWVEVRVTEG